MNPGTLMSHRLTQTQNQHWTQSTSDDCTPVCEIRQGLASAIYASVQAAVSDLEAMYGRTSNTIEQAETALLRSNPRLFHMCKVRTPGRHIHSWAPGINVNM
jgi:hypothetical protein